MSLVVLKAQGQSLLVDRGRTGAQAMGLSQGGALDEYSYLCANRLLGNSPSAAAVEITLGQLTLKAQASTNLAFTGAQIPVWVNRTPIPPWSTVSIAEGDVIEVGFYQGQGTRLYMAVKGGFQAPEFFSSKSCVPREQLGGHNEGQVIQVGDALHFQPTPPLTKHRLTPPGLRKLPSETLTLRYIPGYQYEEFPAAARQRFNETTFTLSPHMDRMGFRLSGPELPTPTQQITSEGIALGSIQITPDGQPIALMQDRQNIGGYPKIGVIYRVDMGLLAQCAPGHRLRFQEGNVEEAWHLLQQREAFFRHHMHRP